MGDDIAVTLTHGGKTLETTMEGIERLADHLTDAKRKALEAERARVQAQLDALDEKLK